MIRETYGLQWDPKQNQLLVIKKTEGDGKLKNRETVAAFSGLLIIQRIMNNETSTLYEQE